MTSEPSHQGGISLDSAGIPLGWYEIWPYEHA